MGEIKKRWGVGVEKKVIRWTKALWKNTLKQSLKRYFPRYNDNEDCGFCSLLEKNGLRPTVECGYEYGCNPVCPAYEPCLKMLITTGEAGKNRDARRGRIGRAWLRLKCKEHGVRLLPRYLSGR
jgi:hypothetical protein